jgi:hypothetical protein
MKKNLKIAALIAGGALMLSATSAMARVDVDVNIGVPGIFVPPAPVYVQPQPVYVQPRPVYVEPRPVYVEPRPVYVEPRPVYVQPRPVYVEEYRGHGWHERRMHGWRDRDGDGVPNRFDRRPDNPYRH